MNVLTPTLLSLFSAQLTGLKTEAICITLILLSTHDCPLGLFPTSPCASNPGQSAASATLCPREFTRSLFLLIPEALNTFLFALLFLYLPFLLLLSINLRSSSMLETKEKQGEGNMVTSEKNYL